MGDGVRHENLDLEYARRRYAAACARANEDLWVFGHCERTLERRRVDALRRVRHLETMLGMGA